MVVVADRGVIVFYVPRKRSGYLGTNSTLGMAVKSAVQERVYAEARALAGGGSGNVGGYNARGFGGYAGVESARGGVRQGSTGTGMTNLSQSHEEFWEEPPPQTTLFPQVLQVPRPETLLKQAPLYLTLTESGSGKIVVDGHPDSVMFIFEYMHKYLKDHRIGNVWTRMLPWGVNVPQCESH